MGCGYSSPAEGHIEVVNCGAAGMPTMITPLTTAAPALQQRCLQGNVSSGTTAIDEVTAASHDVQEGADGTFDGVTACTERHNICSGSVSGSQHLREDRPAPAVAMDQQHTSPHLDSSMTHSKQSANSLTMPHGSRPPNRTEFIYGFGGATSGEEFPRIKLPAMLVNKDKEGSLSQCGVLFEGGAEEAANDPLHSSNDGVSRQGLDGSLGRACDRSVNQSLVSASHFHRSNAPDSFSVASDVPDPKIVQLRLCKFNGDY